MNNERVKPSMPQQRRKPKQIRSKEKVDTILETAKKLIGERGNDSVSMREIANQAGVPISSIYQYFPDKNAILRQLMEGYFDIIRHNTENAFSTVQTQADLLRVVDIAVDLFVNLFESEPALATLWAGVQANTVLRDMDVEDSRINAKLICDKLVEVIPNIKYDDAFNACFFLMNLSGATIRTALVVDNQMANHLINELKITFRLRILNLNTEIDFD